MSRPLADQCIALTGALAEHGVTDLVLIPPATIEALRTSSRRPTRLIAGQTDLPGVLMEASPGTRLSAASIGLVVERGNASLLVIDTGTDAAHAIATAALA